MYLSPLGAGTLERAIIRPEMPGDQLVPRCTHSFQAEASKNGGVCSWASRDPVSRRRK